MDPGADLGGGDASLSGIRPLTNQRAPLGINLWHPFSTEQP